jgi:hypothetical protein
MSLLFVAATLAGCVGGPEDPANRLAGTAGVPSDPNVTATSQAIVLSDGSNVPQPSVQGPLLLPDYCQVASTDYFGVTSYSDGTVDYYTFAPCLIQTVTNYSGSPYDYGVELRFPDFDNNSAACETEYGHLFSRKKTSSGWSTPSYAKTIQAKVSDQGCTAVVSFEKSGPDSTVPVRYETYADPAASSRVITSTIWPY